MAISAAASCVALRRFSAATSTIILGARRLREELIDASLYFRYPIFIWWRVVYISTRTLYDYILCSVMGNISR